MLDVIIDVLKAIWDSLKKIFTKVVNFFKNIVNWFKAKLNKHKNNPNVTAISIKIESKLESGNYNTFNISDSTIVNTFYDKSTGSIIEEDTEIIQYENLDEQTKQQFGNKEMLILN
ncbi:hypothetical protein [Tenacibaculum finnmarkense]|uniref:hypothetical protein n=1 Tax=Tenacibaculum finnmarkense TaxID=2781243 RepID=UPI001E372097|nr:hypothetical protein [Tenacibaculum finnmarkense]MCD8410675.1 hypothetical protein [Tenacibaculum finnmarkense genomovar ulcerans]